jgi:hypothetical protein
MACMAYGRTEVPQENTGFLGSVQFGQAVHSGGPLTLPGPRWTLTRHSKLDSRFPHDGPRR